MSFAETLTRLGWNTRTAFEIGAKIDALEEDLDRARQFLKLDRSWLPIHAREQSAPKGSPVRWAEKCGAINGSGDLGVFMQEVCAGLDVVVAKQAELDRLIHDH